MNDEQKRKIQEAIKSHRAAIETLEDGKLMEALFESAEAVRRGDKGVRGKDLKRKYERA